MAGLEELAAKAKGFPALFSLQGKRALVVGGNKGLGQAMALALAAVGADVCVVGRGPAGLAETAAAITGLGVRGMHLAVDVTDEAAVEGMGAATVRELGGLDILVNSQGAVHLQAAAEFDMGEWDRVMDVNLKSLVMTCKHAGRHMLEQGSGKIINISSLRGFQGRLHDLAYAPSKGAVNQLTHSLAIEWGPKGINVNAIAPAWIRTEISAPFLDDPVKSAWVMSRAPMGHIGALEDMFGPVVFLASDVSRYVNGHVLLVDGGWLIA
ncbi:MAG: SDR family oxidoreductase [Planctomycetes bacterium]|nr:SDR family oxidoreductase [Planctomycetota bacterium]